MTVYDADFQNLKTKLIDYLKNDPNFNSYNYEGSAISTVINIFSLLEENALFYLNNVVNEFFSSTATQKKNIYKKAKEFSYFPIRKSSAYVDVTFTSNDDLVIPMFSEFTFGSLKLYLFENVLLNSSNSRTYSGKLYAGILKTETGIVDTESLYKFTLSESYSDIDNDFLYVYVDALVDNQYVNSDNLWINSDVEYFETKTNSYYTSFTDSSLTIQFDNGRLFNIPNITDRVRVVYLKSDGTSVNGTSGSVETTINGLTVATNSVLKNGTDEESLEEIKIRTPLFYSTQNRAVTKRDWNTIIKRYSKYSTLKDSSLYGGNEEWVDSILSENIVELSTYRYLGRVIITTLKNSFSFLSQSEIEEILNFLENYKIEGIRLRFLHPNIINITTNISIKTKVDFEFSLENFKIAVNDYLTSNEKFNNNFYKSQLTKFINTQTSILYSDLSFTTSVTVKNEPYKVIRLGGAIVPESISATIGGYILADDGLGVITFNSIGVGSINYETGFILMESSLTAADSYIFNFEYVSDLSYMTEKESIFNFLPINTTIL